jgi:hypothetical protein
VQELWTPRWPGAKNRLSSFGLFWFGRILFPKTGNRFSEILLKGFRSGRKKVRRESHFRFDFYRQHDHCLSGYVRGGA